MTSHPSRRAAALLVSASLLASLTMATVASPVSAAKPKCQGKVATIAGTTKGEVIRGTTRRDIIVAKGGSDRIYGRGGNDLICAGTGNDTVYGGPGADTVWGQLGNDRLSGNAGNDFLAGQIGNDTLDGGINVDTCYQGTGSGAVVACELPVPPAAPLAQAPPPPPPPPDTDGDGIPDQDDACPAWGDAGYGLDAKGCPIYPDFHTACEGLDGTYVPDHIEWVPPYGEIPVPACYWTGIDCSISGDWSNAMGVLKPHCVSLSGGRCGDLFDPDILVCNPCPPTGCEE